jgi:thiamine biosynthesis lipoprotein
MGMPVTVELVTPIETLAVGESVDNNIESSRNLNNQTDASTTAHEHVIIEKVFDYFHYVDCKFSVYKPDSEVMRINRKEIAIAESSDDMQEIFRLAEQTKKETDGYFDIVNREKTIDPSGIVKGWAIYKAAKLIENEGIRDYYVEAGGDIQVGGKNSDYKSWKIGIKNPFNQREIVKIVRLSAENGGASGIATSGTYIRGQHIYNPKSKADLITDIVSLTVIGPNIYEADRFATAAFAMGRSGIDFIEKQKGLEGYMIDCNGVATMTSGFELFCQA